jgi:putative ABC transport system permease protein
MNTLLQDLRYSTRLLLKKPSYTVAILIVLALGIGANTTIFSFVNAFLLRVLPYEHPDRLVRLYSVSPDKVTSTFAVSYPDFEDWKNRNEVFQQMAVWARGNANLTETGDPERFDSGLVTSNFFSMLGVSPLHGRLFVPEDDQPGSNQVVILNHGLWQARFGGDPGIIGKSLMLDGNPFMVIGILPRDFEFINKVDLWMPVSLIGQAAMQDRGRHFVSALGLLKPGMSLGRARAEMDNIGNQLSQEYSKTNAGYGVNVVSLYGELTSSIRAPLLLLFGAALFVLLIACVNVANLQLVRALSRQKEIAIRIALGATRGRLIRQLLTESMMLSFLGGVLGLVLAVLGKGALLKLTPPKKLMGLGEVNLDWRVLAFTFAISLVTGVIFGLSPATRASSPDLNESLKEGGRDSGSDSHGNRLRSLLVVLEIALASMLAISSGLMLQSFSRLQNIDPGFNADSVLTMQISLPSSKYAKPYQISGFYQQLLQNIQAKPEVVAAAATNNIPLSGGTSYTKMIIEDRPTQPEEAPMSYAQIVTPNYFKAMEIPFLSGRDFNEQDKDYVMIVSETAARAFWPNDDAVGKRVRFQGTTGDWTTIIGVVSNVKSLGLETASRPHMYMPLGENTFRGGTIVARFKTDPKRMISAMQGSVWALDHNQPIFNIKTMEQVVSESIAQPRFTAVILAIFAGAALVLAVVGIHGVMAYSVIQRTREIGIRMALGAQPRDILKLILGQGLIIVAIGITIGVAASFALSPVLSSMLFGIKATNIATFIYAALLMAVAAVIACYFPTRKATTVAPLVAMRYD